MEQDNRPLFSLTVSEFQHLFRELQNEIPHPVQRSEPPHDAEHHFVYGMAGLARLLNCSLPTAQKIKKSGRLNPAIKQVGKRKLMVDADKALELIGRTTLSDYKL